MTSAHWVLGATVFLLCQTPATPLGISHIRAWLGHKLHVGLNISCIKKCSGLHTSFQALSDYATAAFKGCTASVQGRQSHARHGVEEMVRGAHPTESHAASCIVL